VVPRSFRPLLALSLLLVGCPDDTDDDTDGQDDDAVQDDDSAAGDDDTAGDDTTDDDTTDPCEDHCSNGVHDCGETGVDCGGACGACPVEELWSEPTATFASVAATADKVVVAWVQGGVRFVCRDHGGWSDVGSIDVGGGSYFKSTRVQADGQGRVHLTVTKGRVTPFTTRC